MGCGNQAGERGGLCDGGAVASAAGAVAYVNKKFKELRLLDASNFTVRQDKTHIEIACAAPYLDVHVAREFTQVAKTPGRYAYSCECLGKWQDEQCSLQYSNSANTLSRSIKLESHPKTPDKTARGARDGDTSSVLEAKEALDLDIGDQITVKLVSVESVKLSRYFYLLSLGSDIGKSQFDWNWRDPPSGADPQCWIYNEREALRKIKAAASAELRDYHEGVDILIKWGEENV